MEAGPAALNDPSVQELLAPLVQKAALAETINIAWAAMAALSFVAIAVLPFVRADKSPRD